MHLPKPIQIQSQFRDLQEALRAATHLAVVAHPDDLEILASPGISDCYALADKHFIGIVVTDGAGAPRLEGAAEDLIRKRQLEQKRAAELGAYGATVMLNHPSQSLKPGPNTSFVEQLKELFSLCCPQYIYTHSLFDRHLTHQAVSVHLLKVLRELEYKGPVYGVEVWGSLDWLPDSLRVALPVSKPDLVERLISCHQSQLAVKNYAKATLGRMLANATFWESDRLDQYSHLLWAENLGEAITKTHLSLSKYKETIVSSKSNTDSRGMWTWL